MEIEVYGVSDVGMRREKNEDSYLINKELNIFIVADGMGGHVGGEYASQLAVRTIEQVIDAVVHNDETGILEDNGINARDYVNQLRFAIQTANNCIFMEARRDPKYYGMGTTSVGVYFRGGRIYVANVGDSRGYLIRDGKISQLTQDHSLVGEQIRAGVLSAGDAKSHKLKNIITRSVGFQEEVDIDILTKVPKNGDRFLLCSDGLSNLVEDEEILEVSNGNNIPDTCHILVDMANARGGDDNITVVVGEIMGVEDINDIEGLEDESTIGI